MKKSNVILQTAIAGALLAMAGSASAVVLSATGVSYATEQFSGTAAKTTAVAPTLSFVSNTSSITGTSVVTFAVQLTNALFTGVNTATGGGLITFAAASSTYGASSNTLLIPVTLGSASGIGLGTTIFTLAPNITVTGLTTAGGTVTATATTYVGTVTSANLATATIVDGTSTAVTLATSAAGTTLSAAPNTSTARIDLTATTPSTLFTNVAISATETGSTSTFKLGRLYIKDNGTKVADNGASSFTTAASANYISASIAAPAGFFAGLGTTGTITLREASAAAAAGANACSGTASATSAVFTLAASAAAATAVTVEAAGFGGITTGSGWPIDVCYTIPGSGSIVQVTGTPTIAVTQKDAATATRGAVTLAATNLQALANNGQTYDVRNYVPAAATGYTSYVRVINTGSIDSAVTVALVDETTGVAGTAKTLTTSLKAGAAANFSSTQVETALGSTLASTLRPRLRISAATNAMNVQTFLVSPDGTVSDMTGAQ